METNQKKSVEVELNSLDLRYAHTRMANPRTQDTMTRSIERYGQLTPVLVVGDNENLVLVDGYLRVGSLGTLGKDTVVADVSATDEFQTLLRVLGTTQQRHWEAVEQAWIIRELKERFESSLRQIASGIGHDISWVSRRLSLIDELPEDLLESVLKGHVSAWAAGRILVPLARANKKHAKKLTEHLANNPLSTRYLSKFFDHYQGSDKRTRQRMIEDPYLFVKAHERKQEKKSDHALELGPEGCWIQDLRLVKKALRRVLDRLPNVVEFHIVLSKIGVFFSH